MKAVFFGGGAHRLVSILRGALSQPGLFADGEIWLHDRDVDRAEAMARVVMSMPEFPDLNCKIRWQGSLDAALDGADAVSVILMAGTPLTFKLGEVACAERGFLSSDNVSPNGAMLALKGAPIVWDLARRMEALCPHAWLLEFANPVAVLSGMINRHTKIKCLGLCAGYSNHLSDLNRILGRDAPAEHVQVEAAGINHLSFIGRGSIEGKDVFARIDRALRGRWRLPPLAKHWSPATQAGITRSVNRLVELYRRLGVLVFSTEPDGMAHLNHDAWAAAPIAQFRRPSRLKLRKQLAAEAARRAESNRSFAAQARRGLTPDFWSAVAPYSLFAPSPDDIFVRALQGIGKRTPMRIVASALNGSAVRNLPADVVCEFSQTICGDRSAPAKELEVPRVVQGIVSSLAEHQTMLADACATRDPQLLVRTLMAYPIRPYSEASRLLFSDLLRINQREIPVQFRGAEKLLR
jgi:6-phospho-beta-glucosidase